MNEPIRLSKRVIEILRCSRSEADHYIEDGWVRVDGHVVEEPQHKVQNEVVEIDPAAKLTPIEPATMLFHQPAGMTDEAALEHLKPETHWSGDGSRIRLLKRHRARLDVMMSLDAGTSGLAVWTQDRRVSRRIFEESERLEQELVVEVTGEIRAVCIERLTHGLHFQGRALPPIKVSLQSETKLRFALKGPRPGQIAQMCSDVGLAVVSSKRLRIGRISLAKMPVGEWRYLPVSERFLLRVCPDWTMTKSVTS